MPIEIQQIAQDNIELFETLMDVFGEVFSDMETYTGNRPGEEYVRALLARESFIALVAVEDGSVIGGLTAYELQKFEQERSELYIYDLAVRYQHRRKGVATALIEKVKNIAATRGAYLIFVQADTGIEDEPAIALYTKLGTREEVLHFDIAVNADENTV